MNNIGQKAKKILASLLSLALILGHFSVPSALAAEDVREVYSLATDTAVQNLATGTTGGQVVATPHLNQSGSPTFTIVDNPGGGNSIQVSNRADTWHTIDLVRAPLNFELGYLYTITISGRIPAAPAGTQFIIGGPIGPWSWLANAAPNANGEFTVTLNVNHTILNDPQVETAFRLQTNNSATYIIDEIVVNHVGSDPTWEPPVEVLDPEPYGYVLRVDGAGVKIPTAYLGLQFQDGGKYEFTMDLMAPSTDLELTFYADNFQFAESIELERGEWVRVRGFLSFDSQDYIRLMADPEGIFLLDNFNVVRFLNETADTVVASFDFEDTQIAPFVGISNAELSIVPAITRNLVHHLTFGDDWETYEEYVGAGAQMEGTRVTNFGREDNYSFRLENVTGSYTSGDGNYLRFDLPEPLLMGGTYEISWWVYVPLAENPGTRNIVGPGIVFNSTFGSPAHQPTNTQPIPDLNRSTPMNTWFQTTVTVDLDHATGNVEHLIFRFRVNNDTQQPSVYFIDDIVINSLGFDDTFTEPEWDLTLPSLAEIYADYFLFGNILEPNLINNNPRDVIQMFLHHYNSVTAENAMKPDAISGGQFQATRPDELILGGAETMVSFAEDNDLYMVGHTLIWHQQSAPWLYRHPETGDHLTRAEAMENMRWFIEQYAGHFEGRIDAWDVTNEVFTNSGGANAIGQGPTGSPTYPVGSWQRALRNYVPWYHAFANGADFAAGERGYDYIYYSFVFARRYAPSALLIYNDFNEEMPAKRNAMATMTEALNVRWANDAVNNPAYGNPNHPDYGRLLIEVIGMQAHYNQSTNMTNVRESMDRFIATGARIHVTELDIQFHNPAAPFELSPAQAQQQADMFAQLFRWYVERAAYIERVTIWGREDGTSWRGQNGATHFDRTYNPKPAFWAIVDPFAHIGEEWPGRPVTCEVVVEGQLPGTNGSEWRICEDGTLEIDSGFINWTHHVSPFFAHLDDITSIEITGPITAGTGLRSLFRGLANVEAIDGLTYFDTSATTDMREMFRGTIVTELDLSSFDTRNVVTGQMNHIFTAVPTLSALNLGESFVFIGNPGLMPIRQTESYTGLWQGAGGAFTSAQLMAQFNGGTMAGTFVWQEWSAPDPEVCEVVARGRFANGATVAGAEWRLCDTGTLEVDSGFINWTLVTSPWHAHRADITEVVFTGSITGGTSLRSLFHDLFNLEDIVGLTYLDTRNVTNMGRMFRGASSLTEIDLSNFDTRNVRDMGWMFFGASGLESLDVTGFDTSNVVDMGLMFREVSSLESLDVTNFETENVVDMREMFRGMSNLEALDLSSFDTSSVLNMNHMFVGLSALSELILGDLFEPIGSPGIPRLN